MYLLLLLLPFHEDPPETVCYDPPETVYVQTVEERKLPVWLAPQYAYPNWTYPGSIYSHLFEEPHYSRLKAAGYTDEQLRSITVREAELLHNHLHNYFEVGPGRVTTRQAVKNFTVNPTGSFQSGCPGGVCPTGRGFGFRIFR